MLLVGPNVKGVLSCGGDDDEKRKNRRRRRRTRRAKGEKSGTKSKRVIERCIKHNRDDVTDDKSYKFLLGYQLPSNSTTHKKG